MKTKENIKTKGGVDLTQDENESVENSKNISLETTVGKTSNKELGGPKGLEPTRYGDWESKGRCYDF